MGRPNGITEELIAQFAHEIEEGLTVEYACDLLYVPQSTYHKWMERGEEDEWLGVESDYRAFMEAIKNAYAKFIKASRDRIRQGANGWQGTAWWLERTNARFMPKQQIQADEDGKVTVVIGGKAKGPVPAKPPNARK